MVIGVQIHVRNQGGTYGPTTRNHYYLPVNYHGRTALINPNKGRWSLRENEQYDVFVVADVPYWLSEQNQCLFSIIDNGRLVLGQEQERLAKFPLPVNASDPYHGYPVNCEQEQNRPDLDLLDLWERENVITPHVRRKIERGSL